MVPASLIHRKLDHLPNNAMESEKSDWVALDSLGRRKYNHIPIAYIFIMGPPHSSITFR